MYCMISLKEVYLYGTVIPTCIELIISLKLIIQLYEFHKKPVYRRIVSKRKLLSQN